MCVRLTRRSRPNEARQVDCDGYESSKSLGGCLLPAKAGSSPALHCMRLDLSITTTVRHFFSLALSRSPLDQVPHRPLLISPLANENERPEHASYVSGYF